MDKPVNIEYRKCRTPAGKFSITACLTSLKSERWIYGFVTPLENGGDYIRNYSRRGNFSAMTPRNSYYNLVNFPPLQSVLIRKNATHSCGSGLALFAVQRRCAVRAEHELPALTGETFLLKNSRAPGILLSFVFRRSRSFASLHGSWAAVEFAAATNVCRWIAAGQRPAPCNFVFPHFRFPIHRMLCTEFLKRNAEKVEREAVPNGSFSEKSGFLIGGKPAFFLSR